MRQINPLNNFCPGNFLSATLTIPRSVSRWFSWIIPSCLSPIQAIDGCYALAIKPDNLNFTFLIFFCTFKDFLLYEFDLKGVWLSVSSSSCKLQNVISLTFFAILRVLATSNQGRREGGGVPGVTTLGPGPKRGPDTKCYKFTSTARYEVKLIEDWLRNDSERMGFCNLRLSMVRY